MDWFSLVLLDGLIIDGLIIDVRKGLQGINFSRSAHLMLSVQSRLSPLISWFVARM